MCASAQKMSSSFRVRFRRRRAILNKLKLFQMKNSPSNGLREQERNALLGIHFPQVRSSEHTLSEAIDRYISEELPRKPRKCSKCSATS